MSDKYIYIPRDEFTEEEINKKLITATKLLLSLGYTLLVKDEGVGVCIEFSKNDPEVEDYMIKSVSVEEWEDYLSQKYTADDSDYEIDIM